MGDRVGGREGTDVPALAAIVEPDLRVVDLRLIDVGKIGAEIEAFDRNIVELDIGRLRNLNANAAGDEIARKSYVADNEIAFDRRGVAGVFDRGPGERRARDAGARLPVAKDVNFAEIARRQR